MTTPGRFSIQKKDAFILASLLVLTLLFRVQTLMLPHSGADERDYWYSAKTLTQGLEYPRLQHRTVRWAVILPTALGQALTGDGANAYYFMPLLLSLSQTLLIYVLGKGLYNRKAGFVAALLLTLFPYMIRAGSQVRPEIYSITYIALCLLFLFMYWEKRTPRYLVALAIALFVAYGAKITNLYYLPGILLALWIRERRIGPLFTLCSVLFALYLLETAVLGIFFGFPLGRLQIIAQNHLSTLEGYAPEEMALTFLGLFKRYSLRHLQWYWWIIFLPALLSGIYLAKKEESFLSLLILSCGFFFFITFGVSSVDPFVPVEPFNNRYFLTVLVPLILMLSTTIAMAYERIASIPRLKKKLSPSSMLASSLYSLAAVATILIVFNLALVTGFLPSSFSRYTFNPVAGEKHPFALNRHYTKMLNEAYANGIPIVSYTENGGGAQLYSCEQYYLELQYIRNGLPKIDATILGDKKVSYLLKEGRIEDFPKRVVYAERNQIKYELLDIQELPLKYGTWKRSEE